MTVIYRVTAIYRAVIYRAQSKLTASPFCFVICKNIETLILNANNKSFPGPSFEKLDALCTDISLSNGLVPIKSTG